MPLFSAGGENCEIENDSRSLLQQNAKKGISADETMNELRTESKEFIKGACATPSPEGTCTYSAEYMLTKGSVGEVPKDMLIKDGGAGRGSEELAASINSKYDIEFNGIRFEASPLSSSDAKTEAFRFRTAYRTKIGTEASSVPLIQRIGARSSGQNIGKLISGMEEGELGLLSHEMEAEVGGHAVVIYRDSASKFTVYDSGYLTKMDISMNPGEDVASSILPKYADQMEAVTRSSSRPDIFEDIYFLKIDTHQLAFTTHF